MKKVEEYFNQIGVTRINLFVELHNLNVISFYEKCGYIAYEPNAILLKKELKKNYVVGNLRG